MPKAQAYMSRGIYVNGQVHYFSLGTDSNHQTISHEVGTTLDSSTQLLTVVPDAAAPLDSCTPDDGSVSMNGAVFDNKIFLAFTGNPGCNTNPATGDTHLYFAAWDLTTNMFVETYNNLNPNSSNQPQYARDLGPVSHTDKNTTIGDNQYTDQASAAIVVFNPNQPAPNNQSQLYVFADNAVYTSGDGVNWLRYPALLGNDWEPLDAVTFYPPDADPMILLIYGNISATDWPSGYTSLYAGTWNGQFDTDSVLNGKTIPITTPDTGDVYGTSQFRSAALLAGTASPNSIPYDANDPGFSAGARTPSLQLFLGAVAEWSGYDTYWPCVRRLEYNYNTSGGQWTVDPELYVPTGYGYSTLKVFPWFETECTTTNNIQRQYLVANAFGGGANGKTNLGFSFLSDAMVPQNTDIPLSCTSSGGTKTDTGAGDPDEQATLRKYWTLVGVFMGSPPFAVNNATAPAEI
jgi:hypothetical protein